MPECALHVSLAYYTDKYVCVSVAQARRTLQRSPSLDQSIDGVYGSGSNVEQAELAARKDV